MIASGEQITNARTLLGWSKADLARAAGLDRKAVVWWERKATIAGITQSPGAEKIASALQRAGVRFPEPPAPESEPESANAVLIRRGVLRRRPEPKIVRRLNLALIVEPSRCPQGPDWRVVHGVECGARTRKGVPCKRPAYPNGRCRNHGGLSTGPRTVAGRARCVEAARRRWRSVVTRESLHAEQRA